MLRWCPPAPEQALQVAPAPREALQLEQALVLAAAGKLEHAYDVAQQLPATGCASPSAAFASAATSGLIRHAQWTAALQSAADQHAKLAAQNGKGKGESLLLVIISTAHEH